MTPPTTGTTPAMSVPTLVAKKASLFQGRRYPENPNPMASTRSAKPLSQVRSRGGLYALRNRTEKRWTKAAAIIRFADQEWIDRISQPNSTWVTMNWTDSYASCDDGR